MASAISTLTIGRRRRGGFDPLADAARDPTIRSRLEALAARIIAALDAADAPTLDMEPDVDGEAEPAEFSLQPIALAPSVRPIAYQPSPATMRTAYRATGGRVPRNLRRGRA
ncbi:hypothetical protein [Muricoccus radiodurans]|uniref:hypothetical protein n=1 Tax=Muricoccus radiodurans TaxID=2231721 RepID=UPI003CE824BE